MSLLEENRDCTVRQVITDAKKWPSPLFSLIKLCLKVKVVLFTGVGLVPHVIIANRAVDRIADDAPRRSRGLRVVGRLVIARY